MRRRAPRSCVLLIVLLLALHGTHAASGAPAPRTANQAAVEAWQRPSIAGADLHARPVCSHEQQIVACGELPVDTAPHVEAYRECCRLHAPRKTILLFPAQPQPQPQQRLARPDLATSTPAMEQEQQQQQQAQALAWPYRARQADGGRRDGSDDDGGDDGAGCVEARTARIPDFCSAGEVHIREQTVPALTRSQIRAVKAAARARLGPRFQQRYAAIKQAAEVSGVNDRNGAPSTAFDHPGGLAGAGELALLQSRLQHRHEPQAAAAHSLLSGEGVPPKRYDSSKGSWSPPTGTPVAYGGPYPMKAVAIGYGGWDKAGQCPPNYPPQAPKHLCSHVAAVELDGQLSYKYALAHLATAQPLFTEQLHGLVAAWAGVNKAWGLRDENGPLEAAWTVAAMAKALESVRGAAGAAAGVDAAAHQQQPHLQEGHASADADRARATAATQPPAEQQQWGEVVAALLRWYQGVLHRDIAVYVDVRTPAALAAGAKVAHGNWHSSIAEAWMALAVLSDSPELWQKAAQLYRNTSAEYFRWGRYEPWVQGRHLGECSETLRDIVHAQFGMGGLLQAAELAWQQDRDLYRADGYALASVMEFMARVINAWDAHKNESLLPPGYRFYDTSMPAPPEGCDWAFDIQQQAWFARNRTSMRVASRLNDGHRYLLAVKYLPTGWELGYNHYVGRLGMQLPESAKLLQRYPVDWAEFHWGLGTLTHADSASALWRPGVQPAVLCPDWDSR